MNFLETLKYLREIRQSDPTLDMNKIFTNREEFNQVFQDIIKPVHSKNHPLLQQLIPGTPHSLEKRRRPEL